jgi:hypothetical protein
MGRALLETEDGSSSCRGGGGVAPIGTRTQHPTGPVAEHICGHDVRPLEGPADHSHGLGRTAAGTPTKSSRLQRSGETPIDKAIALGCNAPNPHNSQAWKLRNTSDLQTVLYAEEARVLPATDPLTRQIHVGCGCFIETLSVGATSMGFGTTVESFPEGTYGRDEVGTKPVANITLTPAPGAEPDPLSDYIYTRQTNRRPFQGDVSVSDHQFAEITQSVREGDVQVIGINDQAQVEPLLKIFDRGMVIELENRRTSEETRGWFRFNEPERRRRCMVSSAKDSQGGDRRGLFVGDVRLMRARVGGGGLRRGERRVRGRGRGEALLGTCHPGNDAGLTRRDSLPASTKRSRTDCRGWAGGAIPPAHRPCAAPLRPMAIEYPPPRAGRPTYIWIVFDFGKTSEFESRGLRRCDGNHQETTAGA